MSEPEEEREEVIVLTDENGEEHEFTLIDVLEVDGKEYAVLLPPEDDDDDEAVILRLETDEQGNDVLVDIDSEEEFERVAEAWEELLEEGERRGRT
ncbi:MAG: DUF1292 domain-containing protein [Firmicutes bacterium]|nr:DUF1292 domain-containing protein [Bacillota bacterium]